jgi:hypothetical protein
MKGIQIGLWIASRFIDSVKINVYIDLLWRYIR